MGYASISGQAVTNPDSPRAFAVCDRCARWFNHQDLRWQYDYRGRTLQNLRILVCDSCMDLPNEQLKPRIIPPDPVPIANARLEPFCYDEEDQRYTSNPALPNVDLGTVTNILLSGPQMIDGVQAVPGDLVLVKNQTDTKRNGIYRASTGVWTLLAYNNATGKYFAASELENKYYGALGYYMGAVNVSRGLTQFGKLFQIRFEKPGELLSVGAPVYAYPVVASTVNHYDFYTGIYMAGGAERVTQENQVRVTQEVGQAPGNINEIPGFSNLVPGSCDIGLPNAVPYGCGTRQGLPPGMDTLPYSGALWPTLQNQSISYWLNNKAQGIIWKSKYGLELTFKSDGFWPNPGPGAPARPIAFDADYHNWVNVLGQDDYWKNTLNERVDWRNGGIYGVYPPGGNNLWTNEKCVIVLWHNLGQQNVNFAEIYPNFIEPNKPGPWPFGWM